LLYLCRRPIEIKNYKKIHGTIHLCSTHWKINMTQIMMVSDIVEENGKTIRQNNLDLVHDIPLGTMVEIAADEYDDEDSNSGLRLFVVNHSRDCDGTPLYDMSFRRDAQIKSDEFEAQVAAGEFENDPYGPGLRIHYKGYYSGMILRHYGRDSLIVL
jgi:hypothetical protein